MSIEVKLLNLQAIRNLLAPYRYLYCVDLEATCDEVGESESPRPLAVVPDQTETIEIGLVVVDLETLEIVDEFQRFVRPRINPILTDFCKKLTSIQQTNVDSAGTYVDVGQELGTFIARYSNAAWASWGDYDARQLERDAEFAGCRSVLAGLSHFNAKNWHAGLYDNRPKGLKSTAVVKALARKQSRISRPARSSILTILLHLEDRSVLTLSEHTSELRSNAPSPLVAYRDSNLVSYTPNILKFLTCVK